MRAAGTWGTHAVQRRQMKPASCAQQVHSLDGLPVQLGQPINNLLLQLRSLVLASIPAQEGARQAGKRRGAVRAGAFVLSPYTHVKSAGQGWAPSGRVPAVTISATPLPRAQQCWAQAAAGRSEESYVKGEFGMHRTHAGKPAGLTTRHRCSHRAGGSRQTGRPPA